MMARLYASVVMLVFCGAVLSPAIPDADGRRGDGYPLSWFPMFASARPDVEKVSYVFALTPDGKRHKMHTRWWAAGRLSEGRSHLNATIKEGREATGVFCARLADKLATKKSGWQSEAVSVHIARGTFATEAYFRDDDRTPLTEKVVFSCDIP